MARYKVQRYAPALISFIVRCLAFLRVGHEDLISQPRRTMVALTPVAANIYGGGAQRAEAQTSGPEVFQCAGREILKSRSVGAGAHGTVYVDAEGSVVAKVSQENADAIVKAECAMLRRLEESGVPNTERCVGECEIDGHDVAVFSPYFPGARQISQTLVAGLAAQARQVLVQKSAAFLVRCLAAGVAVSDLQALVRPDGEILFIDFTEARAVDGSMGAARATQFLSEWCSVMPPEVHNVMAEAIITQITALGPRTLSTTAARALAEMPLPAAPDTTLQELEDAAWRAAR